MLSYMTLSRVIIIRDIEFNYNVDNRIRKRPDIVRDLEVIFDLKFSFGLHIESTATSACRLGFVIRNGREFNDVERLKLLHITFVRLSRKYASVVWSSPYNICIAALEKVQRRFLKSLVFFSDNLYLLPTKSVAKYIQNIPVNVPS